MHLLIAGCTGGTGRAATVLALQAGHQITAIARHPERLGLEHPRLRTAAVDVRDASVLSRHMTGVDAVISALGIGMHRHATDVYSAGSAAILQAMAHNEVRRLIVQSSSALDPAPVDRSLPYRGVMAVLHRVLAEPYADMRAMEERVTAGAVDWTLVRAARLTDGPLTGRLRVGVGTGLHAAWSVSRSDCAWWMVDHLADAEVVHRVVTLAS